jgi:hypothetical protein
MISSRLTHVRRKLELAKRPVSITGVITVALSH